MVMAFSGLPACAACVVARVWRPGRARGRRAWSPRRRSRRGSRGFDAPAAAGLRAV